VTTAVNQQNVILPSGTAKIGSLEYNVLMNGSPDVITGLNDLPVKKVNGAMVYLRDVAHVRDGYVPQTSMVLTNGTKGALLPILKAQGASTLDVVSRTRAALPGIQATLPPDLEIKPIADQSVQRPRIGEAAFATAKGTAGNTILNCVLRCRELPPKVEAGLKPR